MILIGSTGERYAYDRLGRVNRVESTLGRFNYGYLNDTNQLVSALLEGGSIQRKLSYEDNKGDRRLSGIDHTNVSSRYNYTQSVGNLITNLTETNANQRQAWSCTMKTGRVVYGKTENGWLSARSVWVSIMLAVCIHCGNIKRESAAKCSVCRFQPQSAEDKAKSLILSTGYEVDGEYRGKTKEELMTIAAAIKNNHQYTFDEVEVRVVVEYAEHILTVPAKRLVIDGVRWLLPPIFILMLVYLVLFLKK